MDKSVKVERYLKQDQAKLIFAVFNSGANINSVKIEGRKHIEKYLTFVFLKNPDSFISIQDLAKKIRESSWRGQ